MKIVVDTNCLRASVPPFSKYYQLYLEFAAEKFQWHISNEILLEYEEILTKTYSANTAQKILNQLIIAPNTVYAEAAFKWNLVADPDDNKFSDLAISCNCDYLVTNDRGFNVFNSLEFPKLKVIDLASFLKLF
ncbi:putative toxin-antitoxin system toxin component, PIN family [Dyadobacter sp. SG02]|uniref:putative toxin-antitoxin system toxin component, PIN family n=1 Tax=Dyadobacter sp. SG02 TaxID=1855291 RepID=UPI0008D56610|nr:putative toxin-antitoxin system toxin component, PIN family [Dyadobacter sp. SG02]SEI43920.1 putative toxin-antitoxin system toxin component, PIN family [Dyadobacter sp. SG02]